MPVPPPSLNPTFQALRVAFTCVLCFLVVAWLQLEHANLAVWTCNQVMAVFPVSVFQRGVERTLGRGVGILAAIGLVGVFPDQAFARVLIEMLLLLALFYVYFSGRFAYAFLNAGLYLAVLTELGRTDAPAVATQGWEMFLAVLVGSFLGDLVMWLTGGEKGVVLDPGGTEPLFPLRNDWLNHGLMLVVAVFLTLIGCRLAELPTSGTLISVMILTAGADVQAVVYKGNLRLGGAGLAILWCGGSFVLLALLPHLLVLLTLLFAGIFLAVSIARRPGTYGYLGIQMGLVIPLLLVVHPSEIGSLEPAYQRLASIVISMASSVVVAGLWPRFPLAPAAKG